MPFRPLRRRTIALAAAYAMALQALLLSFLPAGPAALAGPFGVLCSHDAGGGTGDPAQHDAPCAAVCAAMGHGISGALPPAVAVAVTEAVSIAAPVPAGGWVPPLLVFDDSHAPRGPPLA